MKARSFNQIDINREKGYVRKSSTNTEKLKAEIKFYLDAPDKIKKLMPKLYRYSGDFSWYEMEYLEGETITELVAREVLPISQWDYLFKTIKKTLSEFENQNQKTDYTGLYNIFVKKALDRAHSLEDGELRNIFFNGCFLNGKKRKPLGELLITSSGVLFKGPLTISVIHGDLCFSNIMVNSSLDEVKLLDPRGGFETPSIYGPLVYDLAKLAQSIYSWYDKIVLGQYELIRSDNGYGLAPAGIDWQNLAASAFSPIFEEHGLFEDDSSALAGLMLAGTPALHLDDPDRAVALALNAVLLLSE